MCGIAGILSTTGRPETNGADGSTSLRAPLERMLEHINHRGPDDSGVSIFQTEAAAVALAHTRLSILDLSPAGHQPMQDARTGNWITFNGEIYNFRDVRERLDASPAAWRSESDTEVILRAYERWGKDCLEHLRGMFAFALWDNARQELFIARDRLGIKPLYYYATDGLFLFGSEVRALLASNLVPRKLDAVALWQYLGYQSVPAPRTLIEGVNVLKPGCWMTVDAAGRVREESYWDLLGNAATEAQTVSMSESRRRVRELLEEATALHLVSDVPVGAFLSGGIDSSAIVALVREAGQQPRTFSVVFDESAYDENIYAQKIAARFQTEHTEVHLTDKALLDELPLALEQMDHPTGDGVNTYVVSRAVRSTGIKVALSGLGGDEFFAGYPSFKRLRRTMKYLRHWGNAPQGLRSLAAGAIKRLGGSSVQATKAAAMIGGDGELASVFPVTRQLLSNEQRRSLMHEAWPQAVAATPDPYVALLAERYRRATTAEMLSLISYAEGRTYMHDVLLRDTDQMSMAHALEVRVPLLDHKLVEYLMGLPDEHKLSNGTPKRLLVESLDGLLPEEIVKRPKRGFTLPFEPWMRGGLRGFCETRLSPERVGSRGFFKPERVRGLWQSFLDGGASVSWSRLWILVVLEDWLERNGVEYDN
ncbi:MAG: asparagine synthase (glutamine-hydrolyzing) [Blastocatellia bacterium]|nr:asparagine synthase (glutamine-hydrolyzing) [Blastocatellia bacterium]